MEIKSKNLMLHFINIVEKMLNIIKHNLDEPICVHFLNR